MTVTRYADYLASRAQSRDMGGFNPTDIPEWLFPFQRDLVDWAVRHGRGAIFADCGMGKTPMELTWADNVYRHTGRPVLILTPLAVSWQIAAEAAKFGFSDAGVSRSGNPVAAITITNYEQLDKFDCRNFAGVVCDESSAIKSFDGVRKAQVTEFLRTVPYRLLGTATAAPNDYMELGTSSEALGHLGYIDMLNRFFVNDQRTSDTSSRGQYRGGSGVAGTAGWRFKGHAERPFWRWVSSWARAIRKPSDYGYDDGPFTLPALRHRLHVVEARTPREGQLFDTIAVGLAEEREDLRRTINERCERAAEALADAESAVAWCQLNAESALMSRLIPGSVEVSGSDSPASKEEKLLAFSRGEIRVLVTKPKIGAWGLNWQHCHRMSIFPSHSYEQYYQAVRRSWRFGQKNPVTVDVVTTEGQSGALANLQRKSAQADAMFASLIEHMSQAVRIDHQSTFTQRIETPTWML